MILIDEKIPEWCDYCRLASAVGCKEREQIKGEYCGVLRPRSSCPLKEVVQCKDCKHYELNSWANVNGIPLIVVHHICKRWGNGCKTDENGFCFMGEKVHDNA